MLRARYSTALRPAGPVIWVTLHNPTDGGPELSLEAQLDTGADRTVFPSELAAGLRLEKYSDKKFVGVNGVVWMTTYLIGLRIPGVSDFVIEAAASDSEPRVLLGRDVLNALHTHLDGPGRMLTLSAQPPAAPTP